MNLPKQVDHVLKESEVFSADDLAYIANKLEKMKWVLKRQQVQNYHKNT